MKYMNAGRKQIITKEEYVEILHELIIKGLRSAKQEWQVD